MVHEHLRGEQRAAYPCDELRRKRNRRREKEKRRVHAHEVPIARRASPARPGERREHEEDERRTDDTQENERARRLPALAREQPCAHRDDTWKEIRHQPEVTPDEKIPDVVPEPI